MAIEESDAELLSMFKALADESRLKIIGLLATRERSVDELATTLKLKPPTVSHHLATLRESGLVDMRALGTTHVYNFQPETLRRLNRRLAPMGLAVSIPLGFSNSYALGMRRGEAERGEADADPERLGEPVDEYRGGVVDALASEHGGEHGDAEHAAELAQHAVRSRGDAGLGKRDRAHHGVGDRRVFRRPGAVRRR